MARQTLNQALENDRRVYSIETKNEVHGIVEETLYQQTPVMVHTYHPTLYRAMMALWENMYAFTELSAVNGNYRYTVKVTGE